MQTIIMITRTSNIIKSTANIFQLTIDIWNCLSCAQCFVFTKERGVTWRDTRFNCNHREMMVEKVDRLRLLALAFDSLSEGYYWRQDRIVGSDIYLGSWVSKRKYKSQRMGKNERDVPTLLLRANTLLLGDGDVN